MLKTYPGMRNAELEKEIESLRKSLKFWRDARIQIYGKEHIIVDRLLLPDSTHEADNNVDNEFEEDLDEIDKAREIAQER
jgi:hypothetical protein